MAGTLTSLGNASKTTYLMVEPKKIALEFTTGGALKKGQPVKLSTTGTIVAWAQADLQHLLIGYCMADAASGDLTTIYTRGFGVIYALCNAGTQNAGIGTYKGYDTTHNTGNNTDQPATVLGYSLWGAATDVTDTVGWMLDAGVAQYDLIRVLLKN